MSFKRMLLASGTAFVLIAPETVTAQQFGYFDQRFDRQRYDRPAPRANAHRPAAVSAGQSAHAQSSRKSTTATAKLNQPASKASPAAKPEPPPAAPPAVAAVQPHPTPLTEEQIAAKNAVEELLSREPALWAARERPDPALAKAAAEKHRQQELQFAALHAEEVRRREQAEKTRAREDSKTAALKAKQTAQANKQNPQAKPGKERTDAARSNQPARTVTTAAMSPALPRRMPVPELPSAPGSQQ